MSSTSTYCCIERISYKLSYVDCSQVSRDIVAILSVSIMGKILPKKKTTRSSVRSHKLQIDSHIDNVKYSLDHLIFSKIKEEKVVFFKKRLKFVGVALLLLTALVVTISPEGKAEVATFYPTACLGGWSNPNKAEGVPETTSEASSFSLSNSAVLAKETIADLYCGAFRGDVPTATIPTKMTLTIVWKELSDAEVAPITSNSFSSSSLDILDATSSVDFSLDKAVKATSTEASVATSSQEVSTSSTDVTEVVSVATSTTEESSSSVISSVVEVIQETVSSVVESVTDLIQTVSDVPVDSGSAPVQEQAPTESAPAPQSFLYNLKSDLLALVVDTVYALDEVMIASSTQEVPADISTTTTGEVIAPTSSIIEVATTSAPVMTAQPIIENKDTSTTTQTSIDSAPTTEISFTSSSSTSSSTVDSVATTTDATTTDTSTAVSETNPIGEILYTLDGENWISLGGVEAQHFSYNQFEIPVTSTSTWADISNIQFKIKSLTSQDSKPVIFVDGMSLAVEYDATGVEKVPEKADPKRYSVTISNVNGGVTASVTKDDDQGDSANIFSQEGGSLLVYKDSTGEIIYSSGIGSSPVSLVSYMFDIGTFTVVVTSREDGCSSLTVKQCIEDTKTSGVATFKVSPTVNTPTKYVHTQE